MQPPLHHGQLPSAYAVRQSVAGWPALTAASLPVSVCRNPRILPAPVRQFSVVFDPLDARNDASAWAWLTDLSELRDATPLRQFEFVVGRTCVAEAMRSLGVLAAPVRRRPNGAPVWPAGIRGSITHTIGFVSAAVVGAANAGAIGIDSEEILAAERARRVASVFATPAEVDAACSAGLDKQAAITLVFSAKEAIFKALNASVHRVFDFHDVQITEVNGHRRQFTAVVLQTLSDALPAGSCLNGSFDIDRRRVHTGVIVAPKVRE